MDSKFKFKLGLYLCMSFLLVTGCLQTRTDIKETETTLNFQNQLSVMQKNNADYSSRVEESLENQRHLNGKIDSIENRLIKIENDNGDKTSSDKQQVEVLNQKVELLQEALTKLENDLHGLQSDFNNKKFKSSDENANVGSGNTKSEPYKNIFEDAEQLFKEKNWKEAILKYDEYRNKNSKGKMVSDATYKTGVCFQELGMIEEAKTFYQETMTKFAKSDSARKAQIRLKGLNAKN